MTQGPSVLSRPRPPFVELGFWFDESSDLLALQVVLDALAELGGEVAGVQVHVGDDAVPPFHSPNDFAVSRLSIDSAAELDAVLSDPQRRVVSVDVGALEASQSGEAAIVTFGRSVTPVLSGHTVQVWFSGGRIESDLIRGRVSPHGVSLVAMFRSLVEDVNPSYAAISFERPLAAPDGFADPATEADFPDFFVSESFIGASEVASLTASLGQICKRVGDGLVVVSSPVFGGSGADPSTAAAALRNCILRASRRWPPTR